MPMSAEMDLNLPELPVIPKKTCSGCSSSGGEVSSSCCSSTSAHELEEQGIEKLSGLEPAEELQEEVEPSIENFINAQYDSESYLERHTSLLKDGVREGNFFIDGIHCAGCVKSIEHMPFEIDGVKFIRVNLASHTILAQWDPTKVSLASIATWLEDRDYSISPVGEDMKEVSKAERFLLKKLGIAWVVAGNVMLLAVAEYLGLSGEGNAGLVGAARWISLALALVSVSLVGPIFFRPAFKSLRSSWAQKSIWQLHMDVPIALGILMGFFYSTWATIVGGENLWFDSITVLIAALTSARWLQTRSLRWAREQATREMEILPHLLRIVDGHGRRHFIAVEEVEEGSIVEILPGELIPVDGKIVVGRSHLNNAAWTGESESIGVKLGDNVEAGGINLSQSLRVKASAIGSGTRIEGLLRKSEVLDLSKTDKLGSIFTVFLLFLAILTAAYWTIRDSTMAISNVVALLVIACPCAIAMARPLIESVNIARLIKQGVHIKGEGVFGRLAKSDTVVFDKTGTLTEGKFRVQQSEGDSQAIQMAAQLEEGLSHPVAQAFSSLADASQTYSVRDRELVSGKGVEGIVNGMHVRVGRPDWVSQMSNRGNELEVFESSDESSLYTTILISVDEKVKALVQFGDQLRQNSNALVKKLKAQGREIVLLSGDEPKLVQTIGKAVGIEESRLFGHKTPDEKESLVRQWVEEGRIVSMIGDGINDASALRNASVGIAIAGSMSPGLSAADVYISKDHLEGVDKLFKTSTNLESRIRIAIGISLAYNLIAGIFAMAGYVHPLIAAIAMPISSFLVVVLSLTKLKN